MSKDFFVLGLRVQSCTMPETVAALTDRLQNRRQAFVVTLNPEMAVACGKDRDFQQAVSGADFVLPDGVGIVWAGRYWGNFVPGRVTGFDLTQELFKVADEHKYKVFLLGATPGVAEAAAENCRSVYPNLIFAGCNDGFFEETAVDGIVKTINQAGTDILLVALGMGKQEKWLYANRHKLNAAVLVGVGGVFDVLAGKVARAPRFLQNIGLEWLFRLYKEPRRFRRMLAIPVFIFSVIFGKRQ